MTDKRECGTPSADIPRINGLLANLFLSPAEISELCEQMQRLLNDYAAERERGARERAAGFEEAREKAVKICQELAAEYDEIGGKDEAYGCCQCREAIAALRQEGK